MSDITSYETIPEGWEHEVAEPEVGIMADAMTHLPCLDAKREGACEVTGGEAGDRLPRGMAKFSEVWTCLDCGTAETFHTEVYTGWDEPEREEDVAL
jgi:hypothetical protein